MKKKFKITYLIAFFTIIIGISLISYPTVSDYVNTTKYNKLIKNYITDVEEINDDKYTDILEEAKKYNEQLFSKDMNILSEFDKSDKILYNELLNINNTGIMGYVEITKIKIILPIYHGTSGAVLQAGAGHIEGSSLPIGGNNTHSVISGHSGLPSSKLFTNINKLEIGDTFTIKTLREVLTYEVDQIEVVEPDDINLLKIEEGKDYVTLVTCTPYGINTHRLLVRGHRIETKKEEINNTVMEEFDKKSSYITIIICSLIIVAIILIIRKILKKTISKKK